MSLSRRNFVIATSVAAAGSTLLSACSSGNAGGGSGKGATEGAKTYSKVTVGTAADSTGPAPEIAGAKKGGTIYGLAPDDFSHLDPGRIYYAYNSTAALLLHRCLTGYKVAEDGSQKLVGDLATDTGTMSDEGKTWTFTLKEGLKWEDGSELTVEDVRHGIERLWAPYIIESASYVQIALTGKGGKWRDAYEGPYKGKHLDSIVTDKAKRTITFKLAEARPDFNFTMAMHSYAAVSPKLDTKEKYDKNPAACGPYKIKNHTTDKSMTLVRNKYWDPATDSIRNAYPDGFEFTFGIETLDSTDRLIASQGNDAYAVSIYKGVPAERIQKVLTDPDLKKRTFNGLLTGTYYYAINTKRVTDLKVRQALNHAWPLQQIRQIYGGPSSGDFATTILSPDILGREKFDVYGKLTKPQGDPAAAKKLLKEAGKEGMKIVYAFPQDPTYNKTKVVIENALKEAGFTPVIKPVDSTTYYDQIQKVDNNYDVMWFGWSPDWPTAYTMIQPLFDSASVGDGLYNVSQTKISWIDSTIQKNMVITDQKKAGAAWAALDKRIMEEVAPIIPEMYQRRYYVYGNKVGGAMFDPNFSATLLYKTFVKA
ncbi:ABC transporter substrate-binding protein [Streptomyces justiciae]|uniref:ABC transporter substrate-binding protein n=1 Tax=Streptomyces justiciae TaxID=2780140 RepID=UPI0021179749|nr:ABC transporter substrate-binding protein [Streptomyces justiciae]MCW8383139.1 ABC transporter substrate-binding protein [Streptomyces justiciae]